MVSGIRIDSQGENIIILAADRITTEPERRTDTCRPSFSEFPPEIRRDVDTEKIPSIADDETWLTVFEILKLPPI